MLVEDVKVLGGEMSEREVGHYIDYLEKKNGKLSALTITIDGDFVDLQYKLDPRPFERIRRITGYLVGTMDHWNDAKTAEERDRVHHTVEI